MVQPSLSEAQSRAYIISYLSTKYPLLMNRSQIAHVVSTDLTDSSAVFCSQLQP